MRWLALLTLVAPCAAHAQAAQVPPPDATAQGDVAVTIYNNDLALVQDRRTLTLAAGRSRQEFADVSAQIRPETVTLSAAGTTIVEQNFDFDLLTPEKLMDKAVGQTVTLVRTDPATKAETRETARVLANNNGTVVQIGNRVEVLDRMDARVVFATLPPNLRARPTLSITLDSTSAGPREATLNYLSRGFRWQADYVALFDEAGGRIALQGWITLTNTSGTSFVNANTLLVAGQAGEGGTPRYTYQPTRNGNSPGTETAPRERLGDYYLYPLAERTTIAHAQQKQVSFLDATGVPATKAYVYRNAWNTRADYAESATTVVRFSSARDGGLGDALPAGTVRIYMRDPRGAPQFIGESGIGHTPAGSQIALSTGRAFDVRVQPTVEKREKLGDGKWRTTMRYRVTNARAEPVTVELGQLGLDNAWKDTRIESETMPSQRVSANEASWKVAVPANGETVLTAVFVSRD